MAQLSREEIRHLIHSSGLRVTAPRVAVLELLSKTPHPLSHREVVDALGNADWDRATLFRNLQKLVEVQLAQVASRAGGITRYELRTEKEPHAHIHPHFACKECGIVSCLHDAELSAPSDPRWLQAVLDADLQVVGRCPDCRQKPKQKSAHP